MKHAVERSDVTDNYERLGATLPNDGLSSITQDWMKPLDTQPFAFSQQDIETSRCPAATSAHFRGRATRYRLAAAIADSQLEARGFHDLAAMFEKIANDFAGFEAK